MLPHTVSAQHQVVKKSCEHISVSCCLNEFPNIFDRWENYYESHRQSNCVFKSFSELVFLSPQTQQTDQVAKLIAAEQKRLFSMCSCVPPYRNR